MRLEFLMNMTTYLHVSTSVITLDIPATSCDNNGEDKMWRQSGDVDLPVEIFCMR